MELKKCPRCGSFYTTEQNVCQGCKTNESLDVEKVKGYIEQYGMNESSQDMSIKLGVNAKNIDRYLNNSTAYGIDTTSTGSIEE